MSKKEPKSKREFEGNREEDRKTKRRKPSSVEAVSEVQLSSLLKQLTPAVLAELSSLNFLEASTVGPVSKDQANDFILPVAKFILECDALQIHMSPEKLICVSKLFKDYVGLLKVPVPNVAPHLMAVKKLLHNVITDSMSSLSAVAVEAYKKYILVSLIHLGQFSTSFPKTTSAIAQRDFSNSSQDHYLGLGKQVLPSVYKRNSQQLTQTYFTLSLEDIAMTDELSPREAGMHVLQMIQDGEIYAAVKQKDGMVRFFKDTEQYKNSEMTEWSDFSVQRIMRLSKKLTTMDELISCDSRYLPIWGGWEAKDSTLMTSTLYPKLGKWF